MTEYTTSRRKFLAGASALGLAGLGIAGAAAQQDRQMHEFTVRIDNVSDGETLATTADGEAMAQPVPLSPGAYAIHTNDEPIFSQGDEERNNGLEEIAEDGMPDKLTSALMERDTVIDAGAFTTPLGADGPSPLAPGSAYEFSFEATSDRPTAYLSFVTMFVPSNDLFYAFGGESGVALFDGNGPRAGNATEHVSLWDAGTEINEEPGVGENQVQRQRGVGVGLVERGTVAPIESVNGYEYPATEDVLEVTLTPNGGSTTGSATSDH